MSFRYRLSVASTRAGIFRFPHATREFELEGHTVELVARDANSLEEASKVHFDGYEFADEQQARAAGDRLRLRLRVLDALLGLGLNVPTDDAVTGRTSDTVKREIEEKHGATVVDSVFGLAVHPYDGRHVEYVFSAEATVRKADGSYLLDGLGELWKMDLTLDDRAEDALAILGVAGREPTDRARFLTSYLALESMIPRQERSSGAKDLLEQLKCAVAESTLSDSEQSSLMGALGALHWESFPSALRRFVGRIQGAPTVKGKPVAEFLAECVAARNAIAHKSPLAIDLPLGELATGLREFTLSLIWSMNRIPTFTVKVPGDQISFAPGAIQIRVL